MKILSIDFDIIMGPSIDTYRGRSEGIDWDNDPYLQILKVDYQMYNILTNYIISLLDELDLEHIHIIDSHNHILRYCPKHEDLHIINIDHHHDIHYDKQKEDLKHTLELHHVNEGNWLYYLLVNDQYNIVKYSWFKNPNSEPFYGIDEPATDFQIKNFCKMPVNQLPHDIDELVLCLSPNYVPPYTHPLFWLWLDIINKHYNTHIEFDDINNQFDKLKKI